MIVLGIDPGTKHLGLGLLRWDNKNEIWRHLHHEVLQMSGSDSLARRLDQIGLRVESLILEYRPTHLAIEDIFVGANVKSAFTLGHVRGVCLYLGQRHGCEVVGMAPRSVKKQLTGYGAADKAQMQIAIAALLAIPVPKLSDAADALAMAWCLGQKLVLREKMREQGIEI